MGRTVKILRLKYGVVDLSGESQTKEIRREPSDGHDNEGGGYDQSTRSTFS